jgi:hypothetical protein
MRTQKISLRSDQLARRLAHSVRDADNVEPVPLPPKHDQMAPQAVAQQFVCRAPHFYAGDEQIGDQGASVMPVNISSGLPNAPPRCGAAVQSTINIGRANANAIGSLSNPSATEARRASRGLPCHDRPHPLADRFAHDV